jgi:hypothetical protein
VKKNLSDYGLKFEIGESVLLDVSAVQSGHSDDSDSGNDWVRLRSSPQSESHPHSGASVFRVPAHTAATPGEEVRD